ncbi:MAG: Abi family protein [Candidatus Hydrogenedentes bacterium]|nr:Abi family protein [Candidatus Hydrogenedentota bacterium]
MDYRKQALSHEQQADQLLQRGLIADREELIERLRRVSYYRLSGYLYPFRNADDSYADGTTLEDVWNRYTFDRHLRFIVLDAIERTEVYVRTAMVYRHAHAFGPFGYTVPANLPNLNRNQFGRLLSDIFRETDRSKEAFVAHFREKYGDQHGWPPIWMATELMSFGTTLTFFRGAPIDIKKNIASGFNQPDEVVDSWLHSLLTVRNACAHHARLWNRALGVKPKIPNEKKNPDWHVPSTIRNDRIFSVITILRYLMGIIAPQSRWPDRFLDLIERNPKIPLSEMGFPENWIECPIWKGDSSQSKSSLAPTPTP